MWGMTGKYPPSEGWIRLIPSQEEFDKMKSALEAVKTAEAENPPDPKKILLAKNRVNYIWIGEFGYYKFPPSPLPPSFLKRLLSKIFS